MYTELKRPAALCVAAAHSYIISVHCTCMCVCVCVCVRAYACVRTPAKRETQQLAQSPGKAVEGEVRTYYNQQHRKTAHQ